MKKYFNKIIIAVLALSVFSCSEPDNAVYDVFDGLEHGAVLRTLERVSMNFNIFNLDSKFEIVVEEQDEEMGDLLEKVNFYASYVDNMDDGVDNNRAEVLVTSFPASTFTQSPSGLPMTTISTTFGESLAALNLAEGEYNGGDDFIIRLELVLTDGRTFSSDSTSGSLQGSYFASPFAYSAGILCVPDSPITGDYVIEMHDSYGDGWQGSFVIATIDGVENSYSLPDLWVVGGGSVGDPQFVNGTAVCTVPEGTETLVWSYVSGAWPGEVTFEIYGPNSGQIIGAYGPGPVEGELALNLCNE